MVRWRRVNEDGSGETGDKRRETGTQDRKRDIVDRETGKQGDREP